MNIGITIGDPAGIGPEIVFKTFLYIARFKKYRNHTYHIFCPEQQFRDFLSFTHPTNVDHLKSVLNIIFFENESLKIKAEPGIITAATGEFSANAFKQALNTYKELGIQALVTGPIDKRALKMAGIKEQDHSQMINNHFANRNILTMFYVRNIRIYFYSKHIPLRQVPANLNREKLKSIIQQCYHYESLFSRPSQDMPFAIAGLNPHAGDGGRFGDEEITVISPVIEELKKKGFYVEGPVPADSVFHLALNQKYSGVLSLYHDQGHIAAKSIDFYRTVSFSLGSPVLRTSVDHGSALDISGKNIASPVSFIAALNAAIKFGNRYSHYFRNNQKKITYGHV